jgi:hypothetical protein
MITDIKKQHMGGLELRDFPKKLKLEDKQMENGIEKNMKTRGPAQKIQHPTTRSSRTTKPREWRRGPKFSAEGLALQD